MAASSAAVTDTSILQRHGLRIRSGGRDIDPDSIDWSRNDIRNFDLVQPPGPDNVLGRVKFLFPNKHDVYMHDTTQKFLFNNAVRAESHGCMRVQNPERFAEIILGHDKGWSPARVESTFGAGDDYHVALDQKIPVYITYFTLRRKRRRLVHDLQRYLSLRCENECGAERQGLCARSMDTRRRDGRQPELGHGA